MSGITKYTLSIVAAVFALVPLAVSAQDISGGSMDLGQKEFESRCAICHGVKGKQLVGELF